MAKEPRKPKALVLPTNDSFEAASWKENVFSVRYKQSGSFSTSFSEEDLEKIHDFIGKVLKYRKAKIKKHGVHYDR